jgi:hypothetical protein
MILTSPNLGKTRSREEAIRFGIIWSYSGNLALDRAGVVGSRIFLRRHHLSRPDPAIRPLYLYTLALRAYGHGESSPLQQDDHRI